MHVLLGAPVHALPVTCCCVLLGCVTAAVCRSVDTQCGLDEGRLARWLVRLEQGYPPNPYHNRTHAADVTRNLHVLLTRGGMGAAAAAAADEIAMLAAYMAAVSAAVILHEPSVFACWLQSGALACICSV
jgi:hypothetical protein